MRQGQIQAAILAIAREGSIRSASERLGISSSALHRQVLALEAEIGAPLFERTAQGVRLSTAGEVYHRCFAEQLASLERARETVAALAGLRFGHVRLLVSPELAHGFAPRQIARFRQTFPRIRVSLARCAPDDFAARLARGEADLALVAQPVFQGGAETIVQTETPVLAVARMDASATPLPVSALFDHDLVLPPAGAALRLVFDLYLKGRRLDLAPAVESADPFPLAASGGRPALQPRLAADLPDGPPPGCAARVLVGRPTARIALAQAEGRAPAPATRELALRLEGALQALSEPSGDAPESARRAR
jgi:DNA-binding transcriptional LysR family regulator